MVRSRCTVLLLALSAPITAQAGGYYYPDSGIVAYGRGGAWIASADSQFAQRYNPAGLVRVERPTVNLGLSAVHQPMEFTQLDDEGSFADPSKNQGNPFLIPQIGFVVPLPYDLAIGFGFYSPFAPDYAYDEDGAQRYTIVDSGIYNFQVGPSLAWRPLEWLAIGAGLQWQFLRVGERVKVTTSGDTDPSGDVTVDLRVTDLFTINGNFGLLVDPIPELSIGAFVQPPTKFRGKGRGELDFSGWGARDLLDEQVYIDPDVILNISLPLQVGFGIAGRPVEGLEIELAAVWEQWSALDDILVENIDVTVTGDLIGEIPVEDTISLPAGFRDVWSIRLGGEYAIDDVWTVRAGGFWENGSQTPEAISVALYDPQKWQVGTGFSALLFDHFGIDASFAWLFIDDLEVRDSTVEQINVFGDATTVVGNGDYRSDGWMVGAQLSWAFGPREDGDAAPAAPTR